MTIYYLYVNTHKITGLKYLGYTGKVDPYKYLGSGEYWTKHLIKHGKEIATEILHECQSKVEIKERGLYYSELWNVVAARNEHGKKIWANLKPESGDGAGIGIHNPMANPIIKEKHRLAIDDPVVKERHRIATIKAMNSESVQAKVRKARNTTIYKATVSKNLNSPEIVAGRAGSGNSKYDHTIYTFVHESGATEVCTRFVLMRKYNLDQGNLAHLISGRCKVIKGWKIMNMPNKD